MKNFILSLFVPRKMEQHRDMNLFVAVLIFLLCAIMCAGLPSIRLKTVLKNNYLTECYAFEETYSLELQNFDVNNLPTFTINEETHVAENIKSSDQSVYELKYVGVEEETGLPIDVNLTIVYEFDVTSKDDLKFDLDSYLKVNPFRWNDDTKKYELASRDVLVVYTKDILYYVFNHGYVLNYLTNEDPEADIETFHYINIESWAETGNWSPYKTSKDENGNIKRDAAGKIMYVDYNGVVVPEEDRVYNNNINELFAFGNSTNIGIFSYYELEQEGLIYQEMTNPLADYANILVYACSESVGTYSYILSFFYIVVLPILWVLVMWLLMRKNSELNRFREYYSICAISFIAPSILIAIVGLFVPYTIISKVAMIVQAVFYFIVVSRINSMPKPESNTPEKKEEVIEVKAEEIETKPIHEVINTDTENKKPSIVE